ncbi:MULTISPECIES: hypothetical protein [Sphingomonas]|nr:MULTISPECIES: hypothetical protein [Sphingomonas]
MRKKWSKPQVKVMKAGDAESQRSVGTPDAGSASLAKAANLADR